MVGEHYSHNVDDAFSGQLQAEQENETQTQLSMPIGQTGVTELQRVTCDVTGLSSMQNSSHARVPHNQEINLTNEEDSNWLHRNDVYQRQQRHGILEIAIVVPLGRLIQPTGSIIRDIAQGPLTQNSVVHVPQLSILHGKDSTIEYAGIQPSNRSNQRVNRPSNDTRRPAEPASHGEDQNDDPYGIFEPVVEHTSLQDCLEPLHSGERAYHEPDEEAKIYMGQDVAFESFQDGRHTTRASTRSKFRTAVHLLFAEGAVLLMFSNISRNFGMSADKLKKNNYGRGKRQIECRGAY
ncbi:hypothetical protein D1007_39103 [Hordeum vulgare]|nr:hypothetical protein D1007_39103 [Hordeum vulgare]